MNLKTNTLVVHRHWHGPPLVDDVVHVDLSAKLTGLHFDNIVIDMSDGMREEIDMLTVDRYATRLRAGGSIVLQYGRVAR